MEIISHHAPCVIYKKRQYWRMAQKLSFCVQRFVLATVKKVFILQRNWRWVIALGLQQERAHLWDVDHVHVAMCVCICQDLKLVILNTSEIFAVWLIWACYLHHYATEWETLMILIWRWNFVHDGNIVCKVIWCNAGIDSLAQIIRAVTGKLGKCHFWLSLPFKWLCNVKDSNTVFWIYGTLTILLRLH